MRALQLDRLGKGLMASLRKQRAEVCIYRADARLSDGAALDQLLAPLPEANELRPRLQAEFFARAWDPQTQRDYWVVSDGAAVRCLTIGGLTLKQAAAVRVRWDNLRKRITLTEAVLADLVAQETGRSVTLVAP
jgi:hypothetical protein